MSKLCSCKLAILYCLFNYTVQTCKFIRAEFRQVYCLQTESTKIKWARHYIELCTFCLAGKTDTIFVNPIFDKCTKFSTVDHLVIFLNILKLLNSFPIFSKLDYRFCIRLFLHQLSNYPQTATSQNQIQDKILLSFINIFDIIQIQK